MERAAPTLMTEAGLPAPSRALDLLVVEDDAAHVEALQRSFAAGGTPVQLRIARSLAEFRREAADRVPDLVVMDINLPDGRAMDALVVPMEAAPFPVLIMTSQGNEAIAVAAMRAGAIDFIVKTPETFARMPDIVERALREWHLLRDRGAAREALRERDTLYRLLMEHSGEAILLTAPEGRVLSANPEACRVFGYTEAELIRLGRDGLVDTADPRLAMGLEQRRTTGRFRGELTLRRAGGGTFEAEVSSVVFRDGRGEERTSMIIRDLTAQKRAEQALREGESRFRTAANAAPAMIWMTGEDGGVTFVNQGWLDFTGRTPQEEMGNGWEGLLHPTDVARARTTYAEARASQQPFRMRFRMRHRDGSYRWVEDRGVPRLDAEGRLAGFVGATMDVNETQRTEQELRIAAAAFDSQEGMFVAGADGRILRVNRAFARITGLDAERVPGHGLEIVAADRFDASFYRALSRSVADTGHWQGEILCRRAGGEVFPAALNLSAVTTVEGEVSHLVGSLHDVSDRRAAEEEIRRLAFYDPLTRLPNRRLLQDRMQHAFAASARTGSHGAVFFIDLDHFKTLNDTRGHNVGDLLLVEVARRLGDCVRRADTVARLGGDEFVVMAEDLGVDRHAASTLAEGIAAKMLSTLSVPCALPPGDPHEGSCSIGVALFRGYESSTDDALRRADAAMYRAKEAGRNGVRFFDPAMQMALEHRATLEGDLRHAAARDQLRLHYQVQMNGAGEAIGAEALVRWEHPTRGLIPPAEFIPLAEETGLILGVGNWVLQAACVQLARWADDPILGRLRLAINVSPRQFRQADFVERVQDVLAASGADPARLKLELTEGTVLDDVDVAVTRMVALRSMGVGFSMDDFGTGYSSLSYLKRLPIEQLKIDRTFIRDLATDSDDAMIVQAIIGMARNLRLDVIAEGVETAHQLEFLRANGCFAFQGYLFSPPIALAAFEAFVRDSAVSAVLVNLAEDT